jgi:hypothetical protein
MPQQQRPIGRWGAARWRACTEAANKSGWLVPKGARDRQGRRQPTGEAWVTLSDADKTEIRGGGSRGRRWPLGKRRGGTDNRAPHGREREGEWAIDTWATAPRG